MNTTQHKTVQVGLRLPQSIRDEIREIGNKETRNLSQQIIRFIQEGIARYNGR